MQNSILDNYKVILINQVINEVNSGKITIKEFAKKLNCTQKRLKDKLNGKYLTIDIVIEMCEALDIDIYEYVDKEKLDEALLKEYKGIYPYIPDSNKLMIVSDMERILKIDNEDKLYKPSNRLLNKIYREIYIDKNITINELLEKTDYSPKILAWILSGEGSIYSTKNICEALNINYNDYIDYEPIKEELAEGKTKEFKQLDLKDKLEIIEYSYLLAAVNEKDDKKAIKIYASKN